MTKDLEKILSNPEVVKLLKQKPTTETVISIYDIVAEMYGEGQIDIIAIGELTNTLHLAFNVLDYIDRIPFGYLAGDDMMGYVIEDGITEIGAAAFWGCNELTKITIPSTVTDISSAAFGECPNLRFINLNSNNITWDPHTVFEGTEYISKIYFKGTIQDWENIWDEPQPADEIICEDGILKRTKSI